MSTPDAKSSSANTVKTSKSAQLFLVPSGTNCVEYNLARFKENVQNSGHYPSVDDTQQPMKSLDGTEVDPPLLLPTKNGNWEGECVNKREYNRYGRRRSTHNHYVMIEHKKGSQYGPDGRFVMHLVRQEYLFGRRREIVTKAVEEQEKDVKKQQEATIKSNQTKRKTKVGRALQALEQKRKRLSDPDSVDSLMRPPSPSSRRGKRGDDDGISMFYQYEREGIYLTKANDHEKDVEDVDHGDEDINACGGDNEGMEINQDDYVDEAGVRNSKVIDQPFYFACALVKNQKQNQSYTIFATQFNVFYLVLRLETV